MNKDTIKQALEACNQDPMADTVVVGKKLFFAVLAALEAEQPASDAQPQEQPVAWAFFFADGEISNDFFSMEQQGLQWMKSDDCAWDGRIAPLYAAPVETVQPASQINAAVNMVQPASKPEVVAYMGLDGNVYPAKYGRICSTDTPLSRCATSEAAQDDLAEIIAKKTAEIKSSGVKLWDYQPTDEQRYQRLRVLGVAPYGSPNLEQGTVLRFQSLDDFVDADIAAQPSRGDHAALTRCATSKEASDPCDGCDGNCFECPRDRKEASFDKARMEEALAQPQIDVPDGLSREELRSFIVAHGKEASAYEALQKLAKVEAEKTRRIAELEAQLAGKEASEAAQEPEEMCPHCDDPLPKGRDQCEACEAFDAQPAPARDDVHPAVRELILEVRRHGSTRLARMAIDADAAIRALRTQQATAPESASVPVQAVTDADILDTAHRMAWRYKHSSDPHHSHTYTFTDRTMVEFVRRLLAGVVSDETCSAKTEKGGE